MLLMFMYGKLINNRLSDTIIFVSFLRHEDPGRKKSLQLESSLLYSNMGIFFTFIFLLELIVAKLIVIVFSRFHRRNYHV